MNRTMPLAQAELRMSEVISALSYALDITEGQPPGHAVRSCLIGMRLADELGLGAQERSDLYYALLLDKPGLLTEAERIEIERHPVHTRELLGRVTAFRELADDASDHHEKLDGSGYPRGLRGEELTPTARILVVADIFEAMTAARPYREPMPIGRVLSALAADAGTKLDRDCVAALHSWVELAAAA